MSNPIGVINEQGFVAGMGLGFTPTSLNETKQSDGTNEEKEEEKE